MRLYLSIVSAIPDVFDDSVVRAVQQAEGPISVVAVGNGCHLSTPPLVQEAVAAGKVEDVTLLHLDTNDSLPWAMHVLYEAIHRLAEEDSIVAYIHDDLQILESGWDKRVADAFTRDPKCGLVGFGGSPGVGADNLYRVPFQPGLIGRIGFFSNMVGAEDHGTRTDKPMPIVFTDGFSMIVRKKLLDLAGGWSWWPRDCPHYGYDQGIACMTRRHGFTAWLVPCVVHHRGGVTRAAEVYHILADKHGGNMAVHDRSHLFVYEHFRDVLPLRL